MGFIRGFTGGITVTLGLTYLFTLHNTRNRNIQSSSLRQQNNTLSTLLSPPPPPASRHDPLAYHEPPSSLVEIAKARWNAEILNGVQYLQNKDWAAARKNLEFKIASALGWSLQESREGIERAEEAAKREGDRAAHAAKDALRTGASKAEEQLSKAGSIVQAKASDVAVKAAEVPGKARTAGEEARDAVAKKAADAKVRGQEVAHETRHKAAELGHDARDKSREVAQEAQVKGAEAKSTVQETISRGFEKGKELVGKAGEAMGVVAAKTEEQAKKLGKEVRGKTEVERVLEERYVAVDDRVLKKSVEEALEERYRTAEERQANSVLKGL